jgi:hypothetical protein
MLAGVLRVEEIVVRQLRVLSVDAEMEHVPGAGGLEFVELSQAARRFLEQVAVERDRFHVRHEQVRVDFFPAVQQQRRHAALGPFDADHFAPVMEPPAQIEQQFFQSPGQAVEPALHVPEPVTKLNVRHEVQQRRGLVGRRPHVLDEIVERVHELRVFDEPAHALVQRAEGVEADEAPPGAVKAKQFPKRVEPLCEIALFGDAGERLGISQKFPKTLGAAAGDLGQLRRLLALVGGEVEHRAVLKEVPPVGRHLLELDVILHAFAGPVEERAENVGHGQNRRPQVEGEPVLDQEVQLAARAFVLFVDVDRKALGGEGNGGR